jgi:hypothetical protein
MAATKTVHVHVNDYVNVHVDVDVVVDVDVNGLCNAQILSRRARIFAVVARRILPAVSVSSVVKIFLPKAKIFGFSVIIIMFGQS